MTLRMIIMLIIIIILPFDVRSIGTRLVFFNKPSQSYIGRYMEQLEGDGTSFNHEFAGFTDPSKPTGRGAAPPQPPPRFSERTVRVKLGFGESIYLQARTALLGWRIHEESTWAGVELSNRYGCDVQVQLATIAKGFAGLVWCINPCEVIYERKSERLIFGAPPHERRLVRPWPAWLSLKLPKTDSCALRSTRESTVGQLWAGGAPSSAPRWATFEHGEGHTGKQSAVAYATKEGHLIQGEERMRILWFGGRGGDDSVWFEVYSVSRGAGLVGSVLFPFIRSMQRKFFREQAETLRRIVMTAP